MATATSESATNELDGVFAFRKAARRRAWACPGAGFALMGRPVAAKLTFALSVAAFLAGAFTAFFPTRAALLTTVGLLLAGTVLWIVEIVATFTAWPAAERPPVYGRRYLLGAAVLMLSAAAFGFSLFVSFKLIDIKGPGMEPSVWADDRLLYHNGVQPERLVRGAPVLFRLSSENQFTEAGALMVGRILAVPGDKLSMTGYRYRVNDQLTDAVAPEAELPKAFVVPAAPKTITVPPDCYFITQDSDDTGLDSQILGWAKYEDLVSTRLYQISRRPLLAPVE